MYGRGGAVIVEPTWGDVIAGPIVRRGGACSWQTVTCGQGLHAKRWFDAVGHYSRTDVLSPSN